MEVSPVSNLCIFFSSFFHPSWDAVALGRVMQRKTVYPTLDRVSGSTSHIALLVAMAGRVFRFDIRMTVGERGRQRRVRGRTLSLQVALGFVPSAIEPQNPEECASLSVPASGSQRFSMIRVKSIRLSWGGRQGQVVCARCGVNYYCCSGLVSIDWGIVVRHKGQLVRFISAGDLLLFWAPGARVRSGETTKSWHCILGTSLFVPSFVDDQIRALIHGVHLLRLDMHLYIDLRLTQTPAREVPHRGVP